MMVGTPPPSSSSLRVQPRPLLSSSSPSRQRQTIITSNAATRGLVEKAPLESVVIRNSNVNNDNDGRSMIEAGEPAAATTGGGGGGTNVRVCIRLRPMLLPSDYEMIAAEVSPVIISPRSKPPVGIVQRLALERERAKGSSSSGMRRHSSGLATPTRSTTAPSSSTANTTATVNAQQQNGAMSSSWQTHSTDPRRITQSTHTTAHTSHRDPERLADYYFDRVFGPTESTSTLYNSCVRSVVESFVDGYHGSVFAYGQTNSGKTHTMTGSTDEPGVVRLAVKDVFHRIRSPTQTTDTTSSTSTITTTQGSREYLVRVSYLEIYNEQIYDLLSQTNTARPSLVSSSSLQHHQLPPSTSVRIFDSRTEGVVVRGLREEIVTCPNDVFALLDAGDARRRIGSTGMNRTSSRSHTVFRLVLESRVSSLKTKKMMNGEGGGKEIGGASGIQSLIPSSSNSSVNSHDYDSDSVGTGRSSSGTPSSNIKGPVRISSLSLVDLAGSESVKATGSTGVRQKEGQYINKSLLTLGHVVHKLSEMSSRADVDGGGTSSSLSMMAPNEHIPYRDSKLTRLLQPSLGGNARVCIICNISPAICNLEESQNTLKFAMRAKRIRQHARITEVADEKTLLRSYREEIEELKRQLKEARQTVDDAVMEQQQQQHQTKVKLINQTSTTPERASYFSTSDEEDNDDAQVLVSAIANLESLILKAGAKSNTRGKSSARSSNNSLVAMSNEDDGNDLPPNRALDVVLMKAESSSSMEVVNDDGTSPPVITSDSPTTASKSSMTTPETANDEDDSSNLLIELHRIQEMLGTVMKKKRKGGGGATSGGSRKSPQPTTNSAEIRTPERDAEVERLRLKLQEQEVTSTMRKADSSFLQGQLNVKDKLLNEVSVLLEALERRQLALETENRQLREDLAGAATVIEDADTERAMLEQKLAERDASFAVVSTPACRDEDDEQPADEDELEENFSI